MAIEHQQQSRITIDSLHETPRKGSGILDNQLLRHHYYHGCSIVHRIASRMYSMNSVLRDDVHLRNNGFDTNDECLSYIETWCPAGIWMDSDDIVWSIQYEYHTDDGVYRNRMVDPDDIVGLVIHTYAMYDDPDNPYTVTIDASVYSQSGYTDAFTDPPNITVESDV